MAAIGPGTADELRRYGLQADLVPDEFRAEALAEALVHEFYRAGNAKMPIQDLICWGGSSTATP